jgi:alcohol dehydrogenase
LRNHIHILKEEYPVERGLTIGHEPVGVIGDTVAVFAQGPIGLCATAGARRPGATTIISVDGLPERMEVSRKLGADHCVDFRKVDPVEEVMRLTDGRGVDVAIEALGTRQPSRQLCVFCVQAEPSLASVSTHRT